MSSLDHFSTESSRSKSEPPSASNTKYGLVLFIGYTVLYGGFMVLNAFYPDLMQMTPLGGINLAVLYGLLLIGTAFLVAVLYDWLCRMPNPPQNNEVG